MNVIKRFYAWVKSLPPPLQTLYYAVETAVALAAGTFLMHLGVAIDAALADPKHVLTFDWAPQVRLLELSAAGGVVKGLIDSIKTLFGAGPTQQQPKEASADGP